MTLKVLILYNARSGHKKVNFQTYLRELDNRGAVVETRTVGRHFNLRELLADADKFDRLVIAGGDGTVSAAAGMLQHSRLPILAYPGGTANLLARNLNLPANPAELAEITLNGKAVATDLGELEYVHYRRRDYFRRRILKREVIGTPVTVPFAIMAGCGFAAKLMRQAQPLKERFGQAAYWVSAFGNLFPRRAHFHFKLDGREVEATGIGLIIINFERIQFDLRIVTESHARDGKLELVIVKARSLFGLLPVIYEALRERLGFSRGKTKEVMETYQAAEMEIKCEPAMRLQFDGEISEKASAFKIRVRPGAALFISGRS